MIETLQDFGLSPELWVLAAFCGMLIGAAKTGVSGAHMLVVPILAGIFGGKSSVGLLLPMLCIADIFGVAYYSRHAEWHHIHRLMPWTVAGILIGLFVGNMVSDDLFRQILAIAIILSIGILIWLEFRRGEIDIPDYWWFSALIGLAGGFSTMIGNAAGPVIMLYLLSMRLPKYTFIGTTAWFFMIVNFFKVPLHIFFWHTITLRTLTFNVAMIPAIAVGALLGVVVVKRIPEKAYRIFIISITVVAAVKLFF